MGDVRTVWAVFWIAFQLAWLVGFVLIGIASFKLTQEQMFVEARMSLNTLVTWPVTLIATLRLLLFFAERFLPT
jgi:hypothetical protein